MGRIIIKAAKDLDLYVEWSTSKEAPTFIGDRADTLDYLRETEPGTGWTSPEARVDRADRTGSSAVAPVWGDWDDDGIIVEHHRGVLPRARLAEFLDLYDPANTSASYALLEPFEDD